ncbi:MAG: VWA domain-containing protein [Deltaproteobacteria bacterium]
MLKQTTPIFLSFLTACAAADFAASDGVSTGPGAGAGTIEAGTLTAGVWDDNFNYETFDAYVDETANLDGLPDISQAQRDEANRHWAQRGKRDRLDIAFVLDTTGSMWDELDYLRAEFAALAEQIERNNPNADPRYALVAYGDEGETYVTDVTDFTSDTADFQRTLETQETTGGGDYPEAPDRGLEDALKLEWRKGSVARMIFWIADAPHHREDSDRLTRAIHGARENDIHIYPVAASGADERTERSMRGAAQYTGGRYIFITDDSGVGGAHKEPSVPCYFVTKLDAAVRRMVDIELTGVYREPSSDEVIRTGGDPTDGACVMEDGEELLVF